MNAPKLSSLAQILFAVVCGMVMVVVGYQAFVAKKELTEIPGSILALLGILAATYIVSKGIQVASRPLDTELEPVREERRAIQEIISTQQGAVDIGIYIRLGLNQMTEYYTINKSQAVYSFRISVGAVIIGLMLIGWTIALLLRQPKLVPVTTLSAVSGLLAQFIGAAYFYLYNRSLGQLNYFYRNLVRLQDAMLALQQVDLLDVKTRDNVRQFVIKSLLTSSVQAPGFGEEKPKRRREEATREAGKPNKENRKSKAASASGNAPDSAG
jgi:hypothetical protein